MKLLIAMAHYPFPPRTGSTIVAYQSIKQLAQAHEIHLLCLDQPVEFGDLPNLTASQEFVGRPSISTLRLWWRYAIFAPLGYPISAIKHSSANMQERVFERFSSGNYDGIVMFEMSAIQYCPPSIYKKLVVHIEDPMSLKMRRMRNLPTCSVLQKLVFGLSGALSSRYERRILSRLAKVLLLSQADVLDMRSETNLKNLAWVPYAVEQVNSAKPPGREDRTYGTVIFSGNMDHPPNVDGALFLLRSVFPLILSQYPSAILRIVGANPERRIRSAAEAFGESVEITGRVEDLAEHLRRAMVSVCPVRLKIGVQTKVLEALSSGTPVVATSAGNSGIAGISGQHLWVEDEPQLFADRVVALLKGEHWSKLSQNGKMLVDEQFSWEQSVKKLEAQLSFLSEGN